MKKTTLGNSKIEVSTLGLGCMNFGTKTSEAASYEIMDTYIECGGNFFDTANNYAIWISGDGRNSERTIGNWLKKYNRKSIVLATKLGALFNDSKNMDFSNIQGLSKNVIFEEVEKSLEALQTDYIDLLYLHVDDMNIEQEEYLFALHQMVQKGYVKNIGCSNFYTWRIEAARKICEKYGYTFFSAIQQRTSYLWPASDADFYPQINYNFELDSYLKIHNDLTLIAYSPLLGGMYNSSTINDPKYDTHINQEKFVKLKEQDHPSAFVLNEIVNMQEKSVALISSSKPENIRENMLLNS